MYCCSSRIKEQQSTYSPGVNPDIHSCMLRHKLRPFECISPGTKQRVSSRWGVERGAVCVCVVAGSDPLPGARGPVSFCLRSTYIHYDRSIVVSCMRSDHSLLYSATT